MVSKKSIWSNIFVPNFIFCHDFKIFETIKYDFLQVKKFLMDMCDFLIANSKVIFSMQIRWGCLQVVKLGQIIDHVEYCTIFSVKPELLFQNLKIVLLLIESFFLFPIYGSKKLGKRGFKLRHFFGNVDNH